MPKKTERDQSPGRDQGEAAARLARWAGALSEAEMALAGGEPQEAERRAKAISAIVRADTAIHERRAGPRRRAYRVAAFVVLAVSAFLHPCAAHDVADAKALDCASGHDAVVASVIGSALCFFAERDFF